VCIENNSPRWALRQRFMRELRRSSCSEPTRATPGSNACMLSDSRCGGTTPPRLVMRTPKLTGHSIGMRRWAPRPRAGASRESLQCDLSHGHGESDVVVRFFRLRRIHGASHCGGRARESGQPNRSWPHFISGPRGRICRPFGRRRADKRS
jgi:hypothetical protein